MKNTISNAEEILCRHVSGFHQYILTEPAHLTFVSESFCDLLGCTAEDLLSQREDRYALRVHHADRAQYAAFLRKLARKEQSLALQYRIVTGTGGVKYVNDTITSKKLEDGTWVGHSVLTDITPLKTENEQLRFLNETIPCGFLKYTCEKVPKVTYINDQMIKFFRFPEIRDGEIDYLEMYKENIFLMIPMEERRRFALYLNRVSASNAPIAGEMTLLRCDGSRARVFGWVTKCVNEQGVEEFQSVCMDITERYRTTRETETKRYLKALSDVYDKIFQYDLSNRTVKCIYGQNSAMFKRIQDIPMQMEDATGKWIDGTVVEEDRAQVHAFFRDFFRRTLAESEGKPPQITYRAMSSSGEYKTYTGLFLKIDNAISLFCCRNVPDVQEADLLRDENVSLKNINENMQELVLRFTDGIAAFEINNECVTPLYASDNICEFFGLTREEWLPLMKASTPIETFVSRSTVDHEEFMELLRNGEAEFAYYDLKIRAMRRIKAICSRKSSDGSAPRYVMLYNVDERAAADRPADDGTVSIRTFGYFDVFVGGKPIAFRSQKSKELFALLVDRRGGYITSEEAISFLWEEEPVNAVTQARYRKVALRLKNILEEYGIADVMESVDGKRRIVADKVKCDLYEYLSGKEEHAQLFKGSYLTNYSWGENTLAELSGGILL